MYDIGVKGKILFSIFSNLSMPNKIAIT